MSCLRVLLVALLVSSLVAEDDGERDFQPPSWTEFLSWVERKHPPLKQQLLALQQQDAESFEEIRGDLLDDVEWLIEEASTERLPAILTRHELDIGLHLIERRVEGATAEQRAVMRKEAEVLLRRLFDLKLDQRKAEVAELETELVTMRREISEAEGNKEAIIQGRLRELGDVPDVFDW